MSRSGSAAVVVELYWASLEVDDVVFRILSETLSAAERDRAAGLMDTPHRGWFTVDHGWRRVLLAAALGCAPAQVVYEEGPHGKPRLAGGTRPHFSASRSEAVGLYALSRSAEVGVDIEEVPAAGDLTALARRVFSPTERAAWESSPASGRAAAFSACWTRKEAHGKAHGTGLVFPLDEIEVWAGDDRPVRVGDAVVHAVDVAEMGGGGAARGVRLAAAVAILADPGRAVAVPGAPVRLDPATLQR
jgi:4'-phosphopantetheinyl transferase